MHACFHGGGGGGGGVSRITKSVGIIAKSMKALSLLKVKPTTGDGEGRAQPESRRRRGQRRRRNRRRSPETTEELQDDKDAAASSSASSSAKIAPAQPHDGDGDRPPPKGRGAKHERCDKCCSPLDDGADREEEVVEEEEEEASDREWAAEPEPGVLMTLVSRGDGTNRLRRIRFSEDYFGDAWEAQSWWADNCDRIVELYSVVVVQPEDPSRGDEDDDDDGPAPPATPCQSEDDEHQRQDGIGELEYSASCSASASGGSTSNFSGPSSGSGSANKVDSPILGLVTEADSITRTARAQHSHTTKGHGH